MGQQIQSCGRLLGRVAYFLFIKRIDKPSMRGTEQTGRTRMCGDQREETKINELSAGQSVRQRSLTLLFMHELRTEQDLIFSQPTEIFHLLNQPPVANLQGLTYAEINSSSHLTHALMQMRSNAPAYQHMSQRKKTYYLKDLAKRYGQKMRGCKDGCLGKEARPVRDLSEGQSIMNNTQSSEKSQEQKTAKQKTIKKGKKKMETPQPKPKRITFLTQSHCKYFSAPNPPFSIQALPLHFFPTY